MPTPARSHSARFAALIVSMATLIGCSGTQQVIGGAVMEAGAGTAFIAVGDSMDGHPRGRPEVVTRRADPNADVPIAMAGGALFIVGGII